MDVEASYRGTDGNGNVIKVDDEVQVLRDEEVVKGLQTRKPWSERVKTMLGKKGPVVYFDQDGDVMVKGSDFIVCLSPEAVILASAGLHCVYVPWLWRIIKFNRCERLCIPV